LAMTETGFSEHPSATQDADAEEVPDALGTPTEAAEPRPAGTETDQAADLAERAESGDEAAELAQAEAGGSDPVIEQAAGPEVEQEEVAAPAPSSGPGEWYVIHTYAGYENKVKANLQSRIGSMQMEDKIFDVVIPMEDVMEIKAGKKQVVQKKVFPGYLLVKMIYDNDSWYVVRNTPGVTGFVSAGTGTKPTPLSKRAHEKILPV